MNIRKSLLFSTRIATGIISSAYAIGLILELVYSGVENISMSFLWIVGFLLIGLSAFISPINTITVFSVSTLFCHEVIMTLLDLFFLESPGLIIFFNVDFILILTCVLFFTIAPHTGTKNAMILERIFFLPAVVWLLFRISFSLYTKDPVIHGIIESLIILGIQFWRLKKFNLFSRTNLTDSHN